LLRQRQVMDTGLRRHDEVASPKSRSFGYLVYPLREEIWHLCAGDR
jgi:hypothetical protein